VPPESGTTNNPTGRQHRLLSVRRCLSDGVAILTSTAASPPWCILVVRLLKSTFRRVRHIVAMGGGSRLRGGWVRTPGSGGAPRPASESLRPNLLAFLLRVPDADDFRALDEDPSAGVAFLQEPAHASTIEVPLDGNAAARRRLGKLAMRPCERHRGHQGASADYFPGTIADPAGLRQRNFGCARRRCARMTAFQCDVSRSARCGSTYSCG
jgi:hypothetical protein